uniref:Uncharacterized protein n=1 Tax=Timema monikensis TaxID=170555 RepID=A0A7R9EIR1_9NEOP|nr:unnamed protein product [Timema monikensis]
MAAPRKRAFVGTETNTTAFIEFVNAEIDGNVSDLEISDDEGDNPTFTVHDSENQNQETDDDDEDDDDDDDDDDSVADQPLSSPTSRRQFWKKTIDFFSPYHQHLTMK